MYEVNWGDATTKCLRLTEIYSALKEIENSHGFWWETKVRSTQLFHELVVRKRYQW